MSNGLKNIQSHASAYTRRERLDAGKLPVQYDDDSGVSGLGLTPVNDVAEEACSEPGSLSSHDTPGGSPLPSASLYQYTTYQAYPDYQPAHGYSFQTSSLPLGSSIWLPTVGDMGIDSLIDRGGASGTTDEPSAKGDRQDTGGRTHDIAEQLNTSLPPASTTRDAGVSSTALDQASRPAQPNSSQAPVTPTRDPPTVEMSDTTPSPDTDRVSSDGPEGSSPSSVMTTSTSASSSFLGSSVSEASSGMSYSFIRSSEHQRGMLDCVVQWLEQWIDQQCQGFVSRCCSSAEGTERRSLSLNTRANNSSSKADESQSQNAGGKRPASDDLPNDDSEDDSGRDPKRPKPDSPVFSGQRRFACPFFKRNPARHHEVRSCLGPGFKTIHRLKYITTLIPLHSGNSTAC